MGESGLQNGTIQPAPEWSWSALCEALDLPVAEGPQVNDFAIDSRKLHPGALFVALPGAPGSNRDGHEFLWAAAAAGAAGLLVDKSHPVVQLQASLPTTANGEPVPTLPVASTLKALQRLSVRARERHAGVRIAVTGSSGKTTVKSFLQQALQCHASQGSFNNHIGVPLSLLAMPQQCAYGVFEVGMNHAGEIAPLSRLVAPDVALVLNVLEVHREHFDSIDGIRLEKLSIANGLRPGGKLVIPEGLSLERVKLSTSVSVIRFGKTPDSEIQLLDSHRQPLRAAEKGVEENSVSAAAESISVSISCGPDSQVERAVVHAVVPGGGAHRAQSVLATIACLHALELPPTAIQEALDRLKDMYLPDGRGRIHDIGGVRIIDESYNANPASMRHALEQLALCPGRRIAVVGDMLELGEISGDRHRTLATSCTELSQVHCVGAEMRTLYDALRDRGWDEDRVHHHDNAKDLQESGFYKRLRSGDSVLIKGSNLIFWQSRFVPELVRKLG